MKGTGGILLGEDRTRPVSATVEAIVYDPNQLSLMGLTGILQGAAIRVLGRFSDTESFTEAAASSSADVLLVCIDNLPAPEIRKIIGGLVAEYGSRPPYMAAMSMSATGAAHFEALKAGARGVILKSHPTSRLLNAITTVADGGIVLPAAMAHVLIEHYIPDRANSFGDAESGDISLTSRQRDVLALVARGLSNSEIADSLSVSRSTVKSHISAMLRSLELRDRTQLVVYAHRSIA
ncbi:DNA-binding NarL/FixJ family response regulator [Streptomyces sp. V4I23]|uniref:LuxR C-terminal-related transcriptional regulator n=1 Tax=Streptomyces sp. V4I23 TaxID=3042282 RepID=UPI0027884DC5|nr:response regulator transcription factor [Streptomyces sp. V4I23]MDQ1006042.1 DNA-binding NarL/FixJ family response regulator [Streptomyces sp. V4I23]